MSRTSESQHRSAISLDQLAAAVAHAVRNPLAGAMAQVESMGRRFAPGTQERESCDRAMECLDRIQLCVANLVELAQPAEPSPREIRLEAWIRSYEARWRSSVEQAGGALTIRATLAGTSAVIDPRALAQSVERLLANALEASPRGAHLRIDARVDGGMFILTVINPGELTDGDRAAARRAFGASRGRGLGLSLELVRAALASFGASFELRGENGETRAVIRMRAAAAAGSAR